MSVDEKRGQSESPLLPGWRSLYRRRHALALGIERIGLVFLRFPAIVSLLAILLAITAGSGVARIKIDDSLSQLFRSDTPEFCTSEKPVSSSVRAGVASFSHCSFSLSDPDAFVHRAVA